MRARLGIAAIAIAGWTACAGAQVYPSRPITVVVPFPSGGPIDVLPRIIAEGMKASLGQTVVVENMPGAGGSTGVGRVARAMPDGYTIVSGGWGTNVINPMIYRLPYDVVTDFEPVALLPGTSLLIGARNGIPAKNFRELTAWVKANQHNISVGTAGIGTASHFAAILFQNLTGTQLQLVNYRGGPPALQDLLAGRIDLFFNQAGLFFPHMRERTMKAYAVLAQARLPQVPDVPTVDEAGAAGFYVSVWNGFWAPKGTSKEIIGKLNSSVVDALANQAVRQRLADLAFEIPTREQQTPNALSAFHKAEIEKWWPVIKASNIKAE